MSNIRRCLLAPPLGHFGPCEVKETVTAIKAAIISEEVIQLKFRPACEIDLVSKSPLRETRRDYSRREALVSCVSSRSGLRLIFLALLALGFELPALLFG